jgi:hypothetical protein
MGEREGADMGGKIRNSAYSLRLFQNGANFWASRKVRVGASKAVCQISTGK